jgi:hypothetical protein
LTSSGGLFPMGIASIRMTQISDNVALHNAGDIRQIGEIRAAGKGKLRYSFKTPAYLPPVVSLL